LLSVLELAKTKMFYPIAKDGYREKGLVYLIGQIFDCSGTLPGLIPGF